LGLANLTIGQGGIGMPNNELCQPCLTVLMVLVSVSSSLPHYSVAVDV